MNLKKKVLMLMSVVLILGLASMGILAYLTDRDSAANVFTVGDVKIELTEEFEQGEELVPGVDVTKDVKIKNTGKNDAWVWATIAIPSALDDDDASKNVLHFNYSEESVAEGQWTWLEDNAWAVEKNVDIKGIDYNVYTVKYQTPLASGETTATSAMFNVYLDTKLDIDPEGNWYKVSKGDVTAVEWNSNDGAPIMYVSAYAIQKENFESVEDAYAAYQAQWGENGTEYANPEIAVTEAEDLEDAIAKGYDVSLEEDVTVDRTNVAEGYDVSIDLNDNELSGVLYNEGTMDVSGGSLAGQYVQNNGEATFTDVVMTTGDAANYSNISSGEGSVATYNNVDITTTGGGIGATDGTEVVFNSGSVDIVATTTSPRYNFYIVGDGSKLTINGGEFSFSAKTLKRAYIYAGEGTTVTVNGGEFGAPSTRADYKAGILGNGTVIIKGGTFGFDPSKWVADGYEAVKDGSVWTVSAK